MKKPPLPVPAGQAAPLTGGKLKHSVLDCLYIALDVPAPHRFFRQQGQARLLFLVSPATRDGAVEEGQQILDTFYVFHKKQIFNGETWYVHSPNEGFRV